MDPQLPSLLDAWTSADTAARNAEEKVARCVRDHTHGVGPVPSPALLAATMRLRAIATERFDRLRAVCERQDVDHSAPGELMDA